MKKYLLVVLLSLPIAVWASNSLSSALETPTWTSKPTSVKFHETKEYSSFTEMPAEFATNLRLPCDKQRIRTKTLDRFNFIPLVDDIYTDACVVTMTFGQISRGYLKLDGHRDALELKGGPNGVIFPIPLTNSAYFIDNKGGYPSTGKLYKIDDFRDNIVINKDFFGTKSYALKSPGRPVMRGESQAVVDAHGLSLSNNNRWLAGTFEDDKAFVLDATLAINPVTVGSAVTFRGGAPTPRTAVTNDGKHVALTISDRAPLIYGLDCVGTGCNLNLEAPTVAAGAVDAKYYRINFREDNRLQAHVYAKYSGQQKFKQYEIFPNEQDKNAYLDNLNKRNYLALGDSFASGEGAFNYRSGTDMADNRCHQSLVAYSELISQSISLDKHGTVACSGAKMEDVLNTEKGDRNSTVEYYNFDIRQSKGKENEDHDTEIYKNLLAGYREQFEVLRRSKPNIITLSITGNDIGFDDKIKVCVGQPGSCYASSADRAKLFQEIKDQFEPLRWRLNEIKGKAADNASVYMVGYPQFFPNDGGNDCSKNMPLGKSERLLANDIVTDLNTMIKKASEAAGVVYVDTQDAMRDYYMCGGNEEAAFNGITAGNDAIPLLGYPLGKESLHPNQLGHQQYKTRILEATANLTRKNPLANSQVTANDISSKLTGALTPQEAQAFASLVSLANEDQMMADLAVKGAVTDVSLTGLVPGQQYGLRFESTATAAGTFTADSSGQLDIDITIPQSLEPGTHTFFVNGPTDDGTILDRYKVVYVAENLSDIDGDGVANDQEKCLVVEPSNADYDKDGIDDGCDGTIGEPPLEPDPIPELTLVIVPEPIIEVQPPDPVPVIEVVLPFEQPEILQEPVVPPVIIVVSTEIPAEEPEIIDVGGLEPLPEIVVLPDPKQQQGAGETQAGNEPIVQPVSEPVVPQPASSPAPVAASPVRSPRVATAPPSPPEAATTVLGATSAPSTPEISSASDVAADTTGVVARSDPKPTNPWLLGIPIILIIGGTLYYIAHKYSSRNRIQ